MTRREPAFVDDAEAADTSTVALLYQQFGDVLIPLESVRKAYFRNRSDDRFRRALREQRIPLPVVRLDDSQKGQPYICIYHLAALIEARAMDAAASREVMITTSKADQQLRQSLIDAVPNTRFKEPSNG